eukprot:CAMPEP_0201519710 /NCGR_PEP_ID=MMETSP0161_2-20130828/10193_1 /ASSEMBLY_ACC=CAM_ASM_000251 /TAXON_ID=180227 /ORGANISM="Neoparamoeba aestuarina, Strain SoJaBio B1-5/56/2" /LENGTH=47 /DNA_ID= /DNA_START= /DNA_END= /DNA_ORIENTATION=
MSDEELFDYSNLVEPKDQEKATQQLMDQCKDLEKQLKEAHDKINQLE